MEALVIYLLKVNISLALFYAGYRFILQKFTFHNLNRFYLLTGLIYSATFPLIDVSELFDKSKLSQLHSVSSGLQTTIRVAVNQAGDSSSVLWQLLALIFWTGVIFMAIRLFLQLCSLAVLHYGSNPLSLFGFKFRKVGNEINPFSFWRHIYINPDCHESSELRTILEHEQIHVRQLHTIDVLLAELSTVFYWFNPGVWLIKKSIKANLEFITDREVIRSGVDSKAYQYALLNANIRPNKTLPVNNFHFLILKKRIEMINKKPSRLLNIVSYALLLPAIMLGLLFSNSTAKVRDTKQVLTAVAHIPELVDRSAKELATTILPERTNVSKKPVLRRDTLPSSSNIMTITVGAAPDKIDTVHLNLRNSDEKKVSIVTRYSTGESRTLNYFLDGELLTVAPRMDPNEIFAINVNKGQGARTIHGTRIEGDVIDIISKTQAEKNGRFGNKFTTATGISSALSPQEDKINRINGLPKLTGNSSGAQTLVSSAAQKKPPLIIIDGIESDDKTLKELKPGTIKNTVVLWGEDALKYVKDGDRNVIIVTTLPDRE